MMRTALRHHTRRTGSGASADGTIDVKPPGGVSGGTTASGKVTTPFAVEIRPHQKQPSDAVEHEIECGTSAEQRRAIRLMNPGRGRGRRQKDLQALVDAEHVRQP